MLYNGIACVDMDSWGLGNKGELLFHDKKDMEFFKEMTWNHNIVMGRKTFESLPGILDNRIHYVLTNNISYKSPFGESRRVKIVHNRSEIDKIDERAWVIGGADIFRIFMNSIGNFYVTKIKSDGRVADRFLEISLHDFRLKDEIPLDSPDHPGSVICWYTRKNW